jgi:hypothetical protein
MITRNNIDEIKDDSIQFIDQKRGDIYIPYSESYSVINEKNFPKFIPGGAESGSRIEGASQFQEWAEEFICPDITTVTYDKSISLPSLLKQLADEPSVYGVVLQKSEGVYAINPLHPIVAFLVSAGLLVLPDEGKLHIFEWREEKQKMIKEEIDSSHIDSYIKDYADFFATAPYIIKKHTMIRQRAYISDKGISEIIQHPFVDVLQTSIKIDREDTPEEDDYENISSLVIPHQLVANGILSPYYGISLIQSPTDGNIKGLPLGPMISGNIDLYKFHDGDSFISVHRSATTGNVCAGAQSAYNPRGWFTLSRVNLNSMFYNNIISRNHVFSFVEASKKVTSDIWGIITKEQKAKLEEA